MHMCRFQLQSSQLKMLPAQARQFFFLARLSGISCLWHPLTPFQQTQSIRPRTHAVTSVLDLRGRSHSADSSSHLLEHLNLLLAAQRHWAALSDELHAHSWDVSFALFACGWHCSCPSRVLGSQSLAVFFTGSSFPIPGCFTFFTALFARVSPSSCQLLIQNHGCRSMDGSSSILTLVTSQASGTHTASRENRKHHFPRTTGMPTALSMY